MLRHGGTGCWTTLMMNRGRDSEGLRLLAPNLHIEDFLPTEDGGMCVAYQARVSSFLGLTQYIISVVGLDLI